MDQLDATPSFTTVDPVTIDLPTPPTSNRYWRSFRGRVIVSVEAREYRERVKTLCMIANIKPVQCPVKVTIIWRRARRSGDLDGRCKVCLDALQGFAYANDSQIAELHLFRIDDKVKPGLTVTVEPLVL